MLDIKPRVFKFQLATKGLHFFSLNFRHYVVAAHKFKIPSGVKGVWKVGCLLLRLRLTGRSKTDAKINGPCISVLLPIGMQVRREASLWFTGCAKTIYCMPYFICIHVILDIYNSIKSIINMIYAPYLLYIFYNSFFISHFPPV
jgi:hypothetical protein